jgi:mRNA interferase MazF
MHRGDIIVAAGAGYAGKPRPCIVLQNDAFAATDSVTVCLLSTTPVSAPDLRIPIAATPESGLGAASWAMIDKIMTLRRANVARRIGRVSHNEIKDIDRAIVIFLDLI